jgi:outer membrane protein OmpA-like peptidoglycan-associated protein
MKISTFAIGILSAAALCAPASAQETDYGVGTHASPLQEAAGTARSMAMGSAVAGVAEGSASLLWNPAGLSRMTCKELGLHSNLGVANTIQETAIFGMPLGGVEDGCDGGSLGGIAASIGYVNYGTFSGTDANGNPTGSYGASGDMNASLGYGKELLPGLSGGVSLKGDRSTYANQNYQTFAADAGLLMKVMPNLDLGVVYSNINLGSTVGGSQPVGGWRIGAGWNATQRWLLAASGELQDKAVTRAQFGTEYLIGDIESKANVLALRAGYVLSYPNPDVTGLTGLTFGLGYSISKSFIVDYAMLPMGELGNSQRLSLTFKFGCPPKTSHAAAAPAPAPVPVPVAVAAAPKIVKPAPVEAAAPIVVKMVELSDEHFDFDKSTLKPEGMAALRENVQLLKDNPTAKVRVAGYTSMSGTAAYNQKLSERRAAAVQAFLINEGGISSSRISTIGYGETNPAAYESNPKNVNSAAAKSNMRVLFDITVK